MLPIVPKPPVSRAQKAAAFAVAGFADLIQLPVFFTLTEFFGLGYFMDDFIDVVTAILLTAICGFRWQFVLAFGMELVPGLDLFPTWTAVVFMIPSAAAVQQGDEQDEEVVKPEMIDVRATVVPPVQPPQVTASAAPPVRR